MICITILGKRYKFRFTSALPSDRDGDCDSPVVRNKEIRIRKGLSEERTLECILHETLYAADWSKDEEKVVKAAKDISKLLLRLGYRRRDAEDVDGDPA
jgi:hypothetical protein